MNSCGEGPCRLSSLFLLSSFLVGSVLFLPPSQASSTRTAGRGTVFPSRRSFTFRMRAFFCFAVLSLTLAPPGLPPLSPTPSSPPPRPLPPPPATRRAPPPRRERPPSSAARGPGTAPKTPGPPRAAGGGARTGASLRLRRSRCRRQRPSPSPEEVRLSPSLPPPPRRSRRVPPGALGRSCCC